MMGETLRKWRDAHPAIALFVFGAVCAPTHLPPVARRQLELWKF
jgi:hypothetical protein